MKYIHSHKGLLTISVCAVSVVYALYMYVYMSVDRSISDAIAINNVLHSEQIDASQEEGITAIYEATHADRARMAQLFVSDTATIDFIEMLESLGTKGGSVVTLSSIEADPIISDTVNIPRSIRIRIEARGSWSSVLKTIMLAETIPFRSSVNMVRIDSSTNSSRDARREWRATFELEASLSHI